jgi:hypothetical protein
VKIFVWVTSPGPLEFPRLPRRDMGVILQRTGSRKEAARMQEGSSKDAARKRKEDFSRIPGFSSLHPQLWKRL